MGLIAHNRVVYIDVAHQKDRKTKKINNEEKPCKINVKFQK